MNYHSGDFFPPPLSIYVVSYTYFHRPGSEFVQQPTQDDSILQRRLEESLGIRDAFLWRLQDPQGYEPGYRLLGGVHVWSCAGIEQKPDKDHQPHLKAFVVCPR